MATPKDPPEPVSIPEEVHLLAEEATKLRFGPWWDAIYLKDRDLKLVADFRRRYEEAIADIESRLTHEQLVVLADKHRYLYPWDERPTDAQILDT